MRRKKTRYTGVYERTSQVNLFLGKPDVAYDYCYRFNGKLIWKVAGWKSEGMTPLEASSLRFQSLRTSKNKVMRLTMAEAWEIYRKDWLEEEKKYCLANDKSLYKYHISELGSLLLSDITPLHISKILKKMNKLSDQTRKHVLALIRRIYRKLIAWRLYTGSIPTDGFTLGKVDNERMRFLTREEAHMILSELDCRSPVFADICRISLYSGLRLSEIFNLKVQHVHLDTGLLDIMDAKAGSREAYINDTLRKVLIRHVEGRKPNSYVFTKVDGKTPLKTVNSTFKRVLRDLEINTGITDPRHKVVFHTFRHTFASWLVQEGVSLYTVAHLMGHKSISMTQRYAKLSDTNMRDAIKKIG